MAQTNGMKLSQAQLLKKLNHSVSYFFTLEHSTKAPSNPTTEHAKPTAPKKPKK